MDTGNKKTEEDNSFEISWVDRLVNWFGNLPGSPWIYYLGLVTAISLISSFTAPASGIVRLGTFDPIFLLDGIYALYFLGLYHYLTNVSLHALHDFSPLLRVDKDEYSRIQIAFSSLSRQSGRTVVLISLLFIPATIPSDIDPGALLFSPYIVFAFLVSISSSITFFALVFRSIKQVKLVQEFHRKVGSIDLYQLQPVHAFSKLTARTGMGLLVLPIVYSLIQDPYGPDQVVVFTLYLFIALLSTAIFVLPLVGMQAKLSTEKDQYLERVNHLIRKTNDELLDSVGNQIYDKTQEIDKAIAALSRQRDMLNSVSTWPWETKTIRGFFSTLILPIFIWMVTRLLERLF